jgi:hypothetical protein
MVKFLLDLLYEDPEKTQYMFPYSDENFVLMIQTNNKEIIEAL